MRRPLVLTTALAAELAVSTLGVASPATAQTTPPPPLDPIPASSQQAGSEPDPVAAPDDDPAPVRTGRADPAPVAAPAPAPAGSSDPSSDTPTTAVRTGRLDAASASSGSPTPAASGRRSGPIPGSPEAPEPAPTERTQSRAPRAERPTAGPSEPAPEPLQANAPPAPSPATHVVVAGDHLWAIAARQVASASGRAPGDVAAADVVTYWVQLCMQNRPHLRSGNPSLIYAGEVIELPPVG